MPGFGQSRVVIQDTKTNKKKREVAKQSLALLSKQVAEAEKQTKTINDRSEELKSLEKQLKAMQKELENEAKKGEKLKEKTSKLLTKEKAAQTKLANTEKAHEKAKTEAVKLKEYYATSQKEILAMRRDIGTLETRKKQLEDSVDDLVEQESNLNRAVEAKKGTLESLNGQLATLDADRQEMVEIVENRDGARQELGRLTKDIEGLDQQKKKNSKLAKEILLEAKNKAKEIESGAAQALKKKRMALEQREGDITFREEVIEKKRKKLQQVKRSLEEHYGRPIRNIII